MSGIRTYEKAVVLVTGGASGIGAAVGRAAARRGATVVAADRQLDLARKEVAGFATPGEAHALDVRDAGAVAALVADVFERRGRLDYLFNNAGVGVGGEQKDVTLDDWRYVVDVNLMGVVHGVQAAYPRMVAQGFGHIVNTASMAGWMAAPFTASYCATKHAVVGLSRAIRCEAAPYGVRVSALCPGVIRTPILVNAGVFGRTTIPVPAATQMAMWERLRPMDVDRFAEAVLADVARNVSIIVHPRWWRAIWWLNRLAPSLADAIVSREYVRTKAEFEAAARSAPPAHRAAS